MPKNKTHSGAAHPGDRRRKLMRERANRRHLFEKKPSTRTRRLALDVLLSPADRKRARRLLGK